MKWFLIAATALLVGCADDLDMAQDQYCEMVGIWMAEKADGVAAANRAGWPDYQGNYAEICQ